MCEITMPKLKPLNSEKNYLNFINTKDKIPEGCLNPDEWIDRSLRINHHGEEKTADEYTSCLVRQYLSTQDYIPSWAFNHY